MDDTDVKVRIGTPEDEEGVMALARLVGEENAVFPLNEDKVREMVRSALYQWRGVMGVIGERDKLEALILLKVSGYWYSDEPLLEEVCVFVHPDFRAAKGGRARKCCEFAKEMSEKMGLPLMIGIISNTRTDGKVKLYERQFGPPAGSFFLYGAHTGAQH
jgi:hypothetical protein